MIRQRRWDTASRSANLLPILAGPSRKKKHTKTETQNAQEALPRASDGEGTLESPAMSAGPMVHARERSALAESWPDPQPTAPTLRCCRQHSKNQLVHTSQVLLSHGARLVHRNLRGARSSRCRATADSTRMTSGSRHAPHLSLGHHDRRPPSRRARFVETKKNDIVDETAELVRTPAMPDVSQETLYPDVLQPRGGALQCSSPQCNLIILVSLIILIIRVSHTDRITPRRTASHRSPRHTQTAANQTPWLGP